LPFLWAAAARRPGRETHAAPVEDPRCPTIAECGANDRTGAARHPITMAILNAIFSLEPILTLGHVTYRVLF
jgi:hypothetical protein